MIDGDTIRVDSVSVRVMGLDTPETFHAQCTYERLIGTMATHRLRGLLASGNVTIEYKKTRRGTFELDKYRRRLAKISVNGDDVADTLISEGHARPYDGKGKRSGWCEAK